MSIIPFFSIYVFETNWNQFIEAFAHFCYYIFLCIARVLYKFHRYFVYVHLKSFEKWRAYLGPNLLIETSLFKKLSKIRKKYIRFDSHRNFNQTQKFLQFRNNFSRRKLVRILIKSRFQISVISWKA